MAIAPFSVSASRVFALESLPATDAVGAAPFVTPSEPIAPLEDFASESGWLARWRADHLRRAAHDGWIDTDRPSFTLSESTVPKGWVQVESGYTFSYFNKMPNPFTVRDIEVNQYTHRVPELNVRVGVTNWLELRVSWSGAFAFSSSDSYFWSPSQEFSRYADLEVGCKLQVTQQNRWIPKSAVVSTLLLPSGQEYGYTFPTNVIAIQQSPTDVAVDNVTPVLNYIYTWSLSEQLSIGGSTGGVFGSDDFTQFFQSAILRFHWSPQLTAYSEFYAFARNQLPWYYLADEAWYSFFDAGIKWRPVANLQFDWRAGLPLGGEFQAGGLFTGVGVSVRY